MRSALFDLLNHGENLKMEPTEYELFVKELHQKLIDRQGNKGIEVKHNVKMKGKSNAVHQIDVYWSNHIAGVAQHYCVECKYWKSNVKKSDVASFISVLNDIGSARGIFVTTKGFQDGAQFLAAQNDIILITANKIINKAPASLKIGMPTFEGVNVSFEHVEGESLERLNEWLLINHDDITVLDSSGEITGTLYGLINSFSHEYDGNYEEDISGNYVRVFEDLVQLNSISYFYRNNFFELLTLNGYSEAAEAIANYILTNESISIGL